MHWYTLRETRDIVQLTEVQSRYRVDALVHAVVPLELIVQLTEEQSLYKVDALVYAEVPLNIVQFAEVQPRYRVDAHWYPLVYL